MKFPLLIATSLAIALVAMTSSAHADYPEKPIRIVVPYQAGGISDVLARLLAEKLRSSMGQPVLVDNKPGANTTIGTAALTNAPPDGYTLMLATDQTFTTAPFVMKTPGYHPIESFSFINHLAQAPVMLVVNPSVKARNLSEFLAQAKAEPGKLSYGSYGVQLNAELFQKLTNVRLTAVPYKGIEAVTAVLGGHVDAIFAAVTTARNDKLRPLATLQDTRTPFMPDVPSVAESGIKMPNLQFLYVLVGPAGMDPKIVDKLEHEFSAAVRAPEIKERMDKLGVEIVAGGSRALKKRVEDEYKLYSEIVKQLDLQKE